MHPEHVAHHAVGVIATPKNSVVRREKRPDHLNTGPGILHPGFQVIQQPVQSPHEVSRLPPIDKTPGPFQTSKPPLESQDVFFRRRGQTIHHVTGRIVTLRQLEQRIRQPLRALINQFLF